MLLAISVAPSLALGETSEEMLARTVYNHVTADGLEYDQALKDHYCCKYIVVDVLGGNTFQKGRPTAGGLPGAVPGKDGQPLAGYVLAGYIIGVDGLASDPVILKSTDPLLSAAALEAMKGWRFQPATINGKPVKSLAVQEFKFKGAPADA